MQKLEEDNKSTKLELQLLEEIERLIQNIENEPIQTGEPQESVQIGRLQVADELRIILHQLLETSSY